MLGWLWEFHPFLMLDDVKDPVNRQLQGVKIEASLVFIDVRKCSPPCVLRHNVPLLTSVSDRLRGSRGPHVERLLWSAFCLA